MSGSGQSASNAAEPGREPWHPEVTLAPAQALDLIAAQFPEFTGAEATPFGNGWDNTAVLVGDVVFRFPRRAIVVPLLETEAGVLPRLAPLLPLATPVPGWIGRPGVDFPWPFLGYRRLPGNTLCRRPLPATALPTAARDLGRFLRVLHSLDAADLGLQPDSIARLDMAVRLPQLRERLAGLVSAGVVAGAGPWLDLFREPLPLPGPDRVPVHGDLYARHLLADDHGRLSGVIDWGDVHAGDPAADLAVYWSLLPPEVRPDFLGAYGPMAPDRARLARLRATFHSVALASYACAQGDDPLLQSARAALENVLQP